MIREMDNRIATIDLNGNHIIRDCKTMLIFLKEKLTELKGFVQTQPLGMTLTKSPFSSSINRGFWDPCFIFTISCVLRANALWMKRNWMITTKTTGGTKMFFDRHVAFSNTTAVGLPIWTTTISCVEGKGTRLMWMFANSTMTWSSQRDMTILSPVSWQWRCCTPSYQ